MRVQNALRTLGFPVGVLVWTVITGILAVSGILPTLRPFMVFVFFLVCPGGPLVHLLRLDHPLFSLLLIIAASLAIDAIVATLLLFSVELAGIHGLLILIAISLVGVALDILKSWPELIAVSAETGSETSSVG